MEDELDDEPGPDDFHVNDIDFHRVLWSWDGLVIFDDESSPLYEPYNLHIDMKVDGINEAVHMCEMFIEERNWIIGSGNVKQWLEEGESPGGSEFYGLA